MSQPTIIAYMKPVCGWSNGVRAIFAKYGLEYDDRDIINNADNYREMVQKTRQPYQPCVQIDDVMLADVSGDEVEAYLVDAGIVSANEAATDVPTDQACEDPRPRCCRCQHWFCRTLARCPVRRASLKFQSENRTP